MDFTLDNDGFVDRKYQLLNWHEVNKQDIEDMDIVNDEISLESTKRKRKRKMNKHKHRKNLRKMKFTLRKQGRK